MKLETEIEKAEIANTGAAFCWRTRLNVLECAHCRSLTETVHIPVTVDCPNLRSAWSQEILTYADGSPIPIVIDLYRCFCEGCLEARRTSDPSTPPAPYQGSNRRCRICGAVDGVYYAKFSKKLLGRRVFEICEVSKGLCNRQACKRNRRFQNEIPEISWAYDKQSYPSGYAGTDAPISRSLLKWSSHPTSKANNKTCKARYGSKILGAGAPVEGTMAIHWIQAKDGHRLLRHVVSSHLDFGPAKKPPTASDFGIDDVEWSRLETKHIRDKYAEYQSLLDLPLPSPGCKIKKVNAELPPAYRTPWFIVNGFAPEIEASEAKQWDEEYRKQHADESSPDYLPKGEISPDRLIETSRGTTVTTDETETTKVPSLDEMWHEAALLKFAGVSLDSNFPAGLYMLVRRSHQPARIYLLIPADDFQVPDDRVYIGTNQFGIARAALAKANGFSVQSLLKCPCRVLSAKQNSGETIDSSDWVMFEDERVGRKTGRGKQLILNQQVETGK